MSKQVIALVALAIVLTGCAGAQYSSIPVVESGSPITPGAMRDKRARQAEATQQAENSGVTVMPQGKTETVQTFAVPSAPIGGIQVYNSTVSDTANARIESTVDNVQRSAPAGGQARLAADENLDGPVLALLTTAKQQQSGGDFNGAASSLERAQRIAPSEPQVLYRLAEVRLEQGDAAQAEQLAQKGLRYSDGRPTLQAGLWDLIARARTQQGNTAGAQEAQRRARVDL